MTGNARHEEPHEVAGAAPGLDPAPRRSPGAALTVLGRTREEQIAAFYAEHSATLHRTVARRAHASEQTIEDACQIAWATLLRRRDITLDQRGLAWLATVATHEAWRLTSCAHEIPAGNYLPGDPGSGVLPEPAADTTDLADQAAARELHGHRVEDFARLKPREREALYLKALGYRYQEIAALTASSYTAVNRRITEGRARLRKLARERDTERQRPRGLEGGEDQPSAA